MYEYKRINIPLLFSILVIIITSVNLWRDFSEYDSDVWWCLNTVLRAKKLTVINLRSEYPLWTAVCPSLTHSFIHSVRHSVVQLILYLMMNKIIVMLYCTLSHYFSVLPTAYLFVFLSISQYACFLIFLEFRAYGQFVLVCNFFYRKYHSLTLSRTRKLHS